MNKTLRVTLFLLLVCVQVAVSLVQLPLFETIEGFWVIRLLMQLLLWVLLGISGFSLARQFGDNSYRRYMQYLETSLTSLLSSVIKISSGDLSARIDSSQLTDARFPGRNIDVEKTASLIDRSITELNAITATPLKRLSFTGGNSYMEGYLMGEQIQKCLGTSGVLLIVIPYFNQVLHALRAKGCMSRLAEGSQGISVLPVVEGHGSEDYLSELLEQQFRLHKNITGIYITDGVTPKAAEQWLSKRGVLQNVALFAHDITEQNIAMLKRRTLKVLLAENFFAQSYNAAMNLFNALEAGWKPISYKIYMDPLLVTPDNYHEYWNESKNERVLTEAERLSLVEPLPYKSGKKWKIAIVMPTLTSFFTMAAQGAMAAKSFLEEMGLEVELLDAFTSWNSFATRASMEPPLRELAARGVNGICTVVFDRDLAPVLNEIVDAGVMVTTFNSEPLNLRDIIHNVSENISTLQVNSQSLASSAEESARANEQVVKGMNSIEEQTSIQNGQLESADESVSSLNEMIQSISLVIDSYTDAVERMNSEAGKGVEQVSETMALFQDLRTRFSQIDRELNQLNGEMGRIRKIVSTIDTFSTDTNVLAINASIQAARAGEQGKAFAVVAKEIRSLSEKSSQATEEIGRIIDSVIAGVTGVVSVSTENMKQVEVSSERFSQVDTAFQVINQHLIESADAIRGVRSSIDNAAGASGTIKDTMNNISAGNKQILANVLRISESLGELSVQSADLSVMAAQYLDIANNQEKVINQLTI